MYGLTFSWLVARVNEALHDAATATAASISTVTSASAASATGVNQSVREQQVNHVVYFDILDIFGFECLESNSFEQVPHVKYTAELVEELQMPQSHAAHGHELSNSHHPSPLLLRAALHQLRQRGAPPILSSHRLQGIAQLAAALRDIGDPSQVSRW